MYLKANNVDVANWSAAGLDLAGYLNAAGIVDGYSIRSRLPVWRAANNAWSDEGFDVTGGQGADGCVFEFDFELASGDFTFYFGPDSSNHYKVTHESDGGFTIRKVLSGVSTLIGGTASASPDSPGFSAYEEGLHAVVRLTGSMIYWTLVRPNGTVSGTVSAAVDTVNLPLSTVYKIAFSGTNRVGNFRFIDGMKWTVAGKNLLQADVGGQTIRVINDADSISPSLVVENPNTGASARPQIVLRGDALGTGAIDDYLVLRLPQGQSKGQVVARSGCSLEFLADSSAYFLFNGGNIGVGDTTAPIDALHVKRNAAHARLRLEVGGNAYTPELVCGRPTGTTYFGVSSGTPSYASIYSTENIDFRLGLNSGNRFYVRSNGDAEITNHLRLYADKNVYLAWDLDQSYLLSFDSSSGRFQLTSAVDIFGECHATSFPTSSDVRFKSNVRLMNGTLERLANVRGVTFTWNRTYQKLGRATAGRQIGVIAQELEKEFPELVTTWGAEPQYRAVDYGRLTAVLLEGVKELHIRVQELQQRISAGGHDVS